MNLSKEEISRIDKEYSEFILVKEENGNLYLYCFKEHEDFAEFWYNNKNKVDFGWPNNTLTEAIREIGYTQLLPIGKRDISGIKLCKNNQVFLYERPAKVC